MATVQAFSGRTPATLVGLMRRLPGILTGRMRGVDSDRLRRTFVAAYAHSMFTNIHRAFLVKSRGGTDETGTTWKPLKPETIAARRLSGPSRFAFAARRGRGLLTAAQDRRWRGIFASAMTRFEAEGFAPAEARAMAGQLAWAILKKQGAQTRLAVLSRRRVPILIDRGRLERSLRPGAVSGFVYRKPKEQIVEDRGQTVVLGTSVPYAARQHRTRRLWPTVRRMRDWTRQAISDGALAVARQLARAAA